MEQMETKDQFLLSGKITNKKAVLWQKVMSKDLTITSTNIMPLFDFRMEIPPNENKA